MEHLEGRRLLATIVVTSLEDETIANGQVTLREAIEAANTNQSVDGSAAGEAAPAIDVIQFQPGLTGTITLFGLHLDITEDVSLIGPGTSLLTIDADGASQIFRTRGGGDISIQSMTLFQGRADRGGALENLDANVTISDSTITGNTATGFGGGISNYYDGTVTIEDSIVSNNISSFAFGANGGGIANFGTMTIARSTIDGNIAESGAGVLNRSGNLTVRDSTISDNSADQSGGGIRNFAGNVSVINSTISGNTADFGAGLFNASGELRDMTVISSTIVGNRSDPAGNDVGSGGGLFTDAAESEGFTKLYNTLIAGNLRGTGDVPDDIGGKAVESISANNLVADPLTNGGLIEGNLENLVGDGADGALPVDQLVDPVLTNHGGPTATHVLVDGSRAVNAGGNQFATTPGDDRIPGTEDENEFSLTNDQRGVPFSRIVSARVDIGSVEKRSELESDLAIDLSVNSVSPTVGDDVVFTVTATNNGPNDATNVNVRFRLPTGLAFVSSDSTSYTAADGRWMVGNLSDGGSAQLQVIARVQSADPIISLSRIDFLDQDDPDLDNNRDQVTIDAVPAGNIFDFGDAPTAAQSGFANDYPVTLAQDGARHLPSSLVLGVIVDRDADGLPDDAAGQDGTGGDDNDGLDDEDGIILIASTIASDAAATTSSLIVFSSGVGNLDAWIDINQDGDWDDLGEQIANRVPVTAGGNLLSYTIPGGTTPGVTAARFRLSTAGGLQPTGAAPDGEVEDYIMGLLDGAGSPEANVTVPVDTAIVHISSNGTVVEDGQTNLFSAPAGALGVLDVKGGAADDTVTIDFIDDIPSDLILQGGPGNNRLIVFGGQMDLSAQGTVSASKFASIDLSDPAATQLTIDAASVVELSPTDRKLAITTSNRDSVVFADADDWELESTRVDGSDFVRVVTNQVTGEVVEITGASAWNNPVEPSDVNNDGFATAGDALHIINEIAVNRFSDSNTFELFDPVSVNPWPGIYYDQNADGFVTPLDALRVINEITLAEGEGEGLIDFVPNSHSQERKDDWQERVDEYLRLLGIS